jgi:GNAT superfamily N-acetyltransferase
VCDVLLPWAHGTVVLATRYPSYYDYNVVRVEDEPPLSAGELAAYADEALAAVSHRRLDFDVPAAGEAARAELVALGWRATRLLWMRHEPAAAGAAGGQARDAPAIRLEEVPYDVVLELRLTWHAEEFGATTADELEHYRTADREVAISRGARVFAVREGDRPIAFAQLERLGSAAEVSQVYVHPDHRGRGLGTALTQAAIAAAGDVGDLWITADDEDRAKDLYARLGFRPAWTSMEFLLVS